MTQKDKKALDQLLIDLKIIYFVYVCLEKWYDDVMNDDVYSLFVMKRSLKTEKNKKKTFFWLEIAESRNDSQCSLAVSGDFCSLEELIIRL